MNQLILEVRDYECDMQGIVNHAVYLNYLEHARHVYMNSLELNFKEFTDKQIYLVVKNIECEYLKPLRSGDQFEVITHFYRTSKLRFEFDQMIQMQGKIHLKSHLVAVPLNAQFKLFLPKELENIPIVSSP
jgi:acyl-CoA thioester hydrolase